MKSTVTFYLLKNNVFDNLKLHNNYIIKINAVRLSCN